MVRWEHSKTRRYGGDVDDPRMRNVALSNENISTWAMNMASGGLSTWGMLAYDYDRSKPLTEQGHEWEDQLGMAVASQIGISVFLYHIGMSGLEFTVARAITQSAVAPTTVVAPLVATAVISNAYIEAISDYAPEDPNENSAWWNSIGAAMAGTFGGISVGVPQ